MTWKKAFGYIGAALAAIAASISPSFADAVSGAVDKQSVNAEAITMFAIFVGLTLVITYVSAKRTKSASDFYAAGGGITGFQNGLAMAGDYMSAASFLGISGLVFASGFDGLIYSVGWLVGWPIVLFLIAERLRNLGKFTFADVASFRLDQTWIPHPVGDRHLYCRRLLPDRADGRRRKADPAALRSAISVGGYHRRNPYDHLCRLWRHEGDHLGADHQGLPVALRGDAHGISGALALQLQPS